MARAATGQRSFFAVVRFAKDQRQRKEEEQSHTHAHELLVKVTGSLVGCHRHAQRGEEKGQRLDLKAGAPQNAVEAVNEPHDQTECRKGDGDRHAGLRAICDEQLRTQHDLDEREQQQIEPRRDLPPRTGAFLCLRQLLGGGAGGKGDLYAAHADDVPALNGHMLLRGDLLIVDGQPVLGVQGIDAPLPLFIPEKGGVAAGDGGGLEHHIAAAGAADGILPVVEFTVVAVGQCEPAPGLPLNLAP